MSFPVLPGLPAFNVSPGTATAGTAFTALIPPNPTNGGAPMLYGLQSGGNTPNWTSEPAFIHVTSCLYTVASPSTTQNVYLLRPLNWTTIKTAVAAGGAAFTLTDDPGIYSTNYRYLMPGTYQAYNPPGTVNTNGPGQVADAGISATNKYVAYQLDDGTWQLDTVTSGSGTTPTMTTGVPNRNGANISAGRILFYFGAITLSNPATGYPHIKIPVPATLTNANILGDYQGGGVPTLNPGDPMIAYFDNGGTAAAFCGVLTGDYRRF